MRFYLQFAGIVPFPTVEEKNAKASPIYMDYVQHRNEKIFGKC